MYAPDGVADYTLMLILMAIRNAKEIVSSAEQHDFRLGSVRGRDLRDLTVGVVGVGNIGNAVIRRLQGFGCRVLAHPTTARPAAAAEFVSLDELLLESDVVTLHLPLNARHASLHRTRANRDDEAGRVSRQHRARGALVDTDALIVGAGSADSSAARRWTCWKVRKGSSTSTARTRPVDNRLLLAAATAAERDRHTAHGLLHASGRCTTPSKQTLIKCLQLRKEPRRMTRRPRIAILFGGCSEEHDVSVKSAMEIAASIDTQKYEPIYIGITKPASGRCASGRSQDGTTARADEP